MRKKIVAMVEDRRTNEFIVIHTTINDGYKLKDAKRDLSQIGTIHKIIAREIDEEGKPTV